MKKHLLIFGLLFYLAHLGATTYYVRTDGNDQNPGTANTPKKAWSTMDFAINQLQAGDKLLVADGTYLTQNLRVQDLEGSPELITTIKAINPWKAILVQDSYPEDTLSVLTIANSSYVLVDGFEVYDKTDTGIGISVRNGSHHVTVSNCYVHDCGCNGISSRMSDYVTIENNVVRDNSKRNEWNCSGISIWHPIEYDQEPGYHIIISRNVAFGNECDLPFRPLGYDTPTDGNGIIVDDFRNTQGGGQDGGYHSKVLVENNLSFNNGGRGFNVYQADGVTLRNNTSYHNLRIISRYADFPGEMTLSNSTGCQMYNNLVVKNPDLPNPAIRSYDNDGLNTRIHHNLVVGHEDLCDQEIYFMDNLAFEASHQSAPGLKKPKLDPKFSSTEDFRRYFGLNPSSPAIDAGCDKNAPSVDRDGKARPAGKQTDIGCFEGQ